jgi:uncharacterized membrane protein YbhN (UPF0104 family)
MARLRFALGLIISAVFLFIALQGQDLGNVWTTLAHANYIWIVPGILTYFLAVLVRTWRWHYLLRSIKPVSLQTLFPVVTIGYMGNNIYPARAQRIYRWLIERIIPFEFQGRVHGLADRFLDGLSALRRERDVLMIFFTSLLIWLLETVKYWFVMHAFPFEVSFYALMLMNGVVNLATTIPASPGYVGTFDAPGIAILQAFGVDKSIATGYTLVLHAALWLPITLLGLFFMARESLTLAKVHADMAAHPEEPATPSALEVEL